MVDNILSAPFHDIAIPEMPHLPGVIPVNELVNFEARCRNAKSKKELINIVCDVVTMDLEDYWSDWCYVLASHRAGKLQEHDLQKSFLSTTKFLGYQNFLK
jgi:hypothetical protein